MIYNDGQAFMAPEGDIRAQVVMDNLIYRRELPVMIGVFINPGRTPEQPEPTPSEWGDRTTNRPTEYNTLDDKYARVIVDELLPVLYKQYNVSKDPERHGIGGSSSGAIAAFTVAWERPNDFRKVLSEQALAEKGYEVNYEWGINRHGQKMLQTVFPETMRWLWRDYGVSTDVHDMVERSFNGARKQQ